MEKQLRTKKIMVKLTEREFELLKKMAIEKGLNVSEFIRLMVFKEVQEWKGK